ncbi:MAG TPA: hypothetical protein VFZ66_22205 [Herpetosiphonaceae bacterium]
MSNFVPGAGIGPISVISRSSNKLDAFAVGLDGRVYTAAWEPGDTQWRGWWRIDGVEVAPCAPVCAVSRAPDKLDIFVVGLDGQVYTAAWEPGDAAWRGWWPVGIFKTALHAPVCAVSRAPDKLDLFAAGLDGQVYTAAWEPGNTEWQGWWSIGGLRVPPGAPVSVVSRSADKLDIFVVGADRQVYTAAWEPGNTEWQGWWSIAGVDAAPRTPVAAVSRSADKLDLFVTGSDGRVYTAAWEPGDAAWRGWWAVQDLVTAAQTSIGVVSRSADKLDLVAPGFDGRAYTAAWEPGNTQWQGWWLVSDLVTGMTDPRVGEWTRAGVAFSSENTARSDEAQGITTDGEAWFLASNNSKTIAKYGPGATLLAEIAVPQGKQGAHVGAPGCFEGWVYVPIQGPFGVWKTKTDFSAQLFLPGEQGAGRFPWCDVNPLNGRLYTSEFDHWNNANGVLFAYDHETLERCPDDDIHLGPTPIHFDRIQGGVFTRRGRIIISRHGPNGLFCFSAITGHCFGGIHLGNFGSTGSEVEGVTVRAWQFDGMPAQVHVLELDNDAGTDDCYLHSYVVPDPDRL